MRKNIITLTNWTLHQKYPNPFNFSTILIYNSHKDSFVTISVFEMCGKIASALLNKKTGFQSNHWSAASCEIKSVSPVVFLYRIEIGAFRKTEKMIFFK